MRRNAKLALVAVAGAAAGAGALFSRWRRPPEEPPAPPDRRAEELRQKLAEARAAVADENDFEVAGMGAETLVEEPVLTEPPVDYEQAPPPAVEEALPEPEPEPEPKAEPKPEPRGGERQEPAAERPPSDEFEAMRRRIHEEGRTAAEEMRRSAEKPDQT